MCLEDYELSTLVLLQIDYQNEDLEQHLRRSVPTENRHTLANSETGDREAMGYYERASDGRSSHGSNAPLPWG